MKLELVEERELCECFGNLDQSVVVSIQYNTTPGMDGVVVVTVRELENPVHQVFHDVRIPFGPDEAEILANVILVAARATRGFGGGA